MEAYFTYLKALWESLLSTESYFKFLILIATYPLWGKIVRAVLREVYDSVSPDGDLFRMGRPKVIQPRPREHLDPFVNVPLAAARRSKKTAQTSAPVEHAARHSTAASGAGRAGRGTRKRSL